MRLRYLLCLLALIWLGTVALTQDEVELTETFTSVDFEFAFDYPADWTFLEPVEDAEPMEQALGNADGNSIDIKYYTSTPDEMAELFMPMVVESLDEGNRGSTIETVELTHGTAYRLEITSDDCDGRLLIYVRDIEDKLFMVRGFHFHDTEDIEPVVVALLDSIRLIPAEVDLPTIFENRDVKFTFQHPERWGVVSSQKARQVLGGGGNLGNVALLTQGRETVMIQVYTNTPPDGAILLANLEADKLNLTKERQAPFLLEDRKGYYLEYSAPFFQQRLVYLLELGEHTIQIDIVVGATDYIPGYQSTLKALLLTVEEVG
jgi:hypothetical protein